MTEVMELVRARQEEMVRERRHFHEHPELSGQETETLAYIKGVLEGLGMQVHTVPHGGVIGVLNGSSSRQAILLRADIDALPILESPENLAGPRTCRSQCPGVMHACGHDAHTAMMLCAARILARQNLEVPVIFAFEQGEENNSGVHYILPYLAEYFNIGCCYATHVRWDIPAGKIALCPGTAMAGGYGFRIALHGQGGHGSRPDLARSPIDCFATLHAQLLALRMQHAAPDQVLTYSLGEVHAGSLLNVIPDTLTFSGTVRSYDVQRGAEPFAEQMRKLIENVSQTYGCRAEFLHYSRPLFEVRNYEPLRQRLLQALSETLSEETLVQTDPWMASETLSAYFRVWPGVLGFLGIQNVQKGSGAGHHSAEFDLDEDAMMNGAAAAIAAALDWNEFRGIYPFERTYSSMEELVSRSL